MTDTLFIADLHLDPSRPGTRDLACRFLRDHHDAASVWIMGDLFEAWLGDDLIDPAMEPVIDALTALSASGTSVHLMHGNRDFLLGEVFARRVGAYLHVEDECVIELGGQRVLLLHGDTLCTGDVDYQRLRLMLRDAEWQREFLTLSPAARIEAAQALRERSKSATADKQQAIMDVDADCVSATFERTACATMIHGHTHRPSDHVGKPGRRLVVGDWHDDHADVVRFDGDTLTLETYR